MLALQQHRQEAPMATQRSIPCSAPRPSAFMKKQALKQQGVFLGQLSTVSATHSCSCRVGSAHGSETLPAVPPPALMQGKTEEQQGVLLIWFLAINTADLAATQANGAHGWDLDATLPLPALTWQGTAGCSPACQLTRGQVTPFLLYLLLHVGH